MDVIGMTQEEQAEVFRMVASILHVGNLEFKQGGKGAEIENTQIMDIAARVLRVTPDALKKVCRSFFWFLLSSRFFNG